MGVIILVRGCGYCPDSISEGINMMPPYFVSLFCTANNTMALSTFYTKTAGLCFHDIFISTGCSHAHATTATEVLLSADLRGIDSHGLARLSGYVRLWEAKRINSQPDLKIVHESPSTVAVDGVPGWGLWLQPRVAMEIAILKATVCGTGWVAVKTQITLALQESTP